MDSKAPPSTIFFQGETSPVLVWCSKMDLFVMQLESQVRRCGPFRAVKSARPDGSRSLRGTQVRMRHSGESAAVKGRATCTDPCL